METPRRWIRSVAQERLSTNRYTPSLRRPFENVRPHCTRSSPFRRCRTESTTTRLSGNRPETRAMGAMSSMVGVKGWRSSGFIDRALMTIFLPDGRKKVTFEPAGVLARDDLAVRLGADCRLRGLDLGMKFDEGIRRAAAARESIPHRPRGPLAAQETPLAQRTEQKSSIVTNVARPRKTTVGRAHPFGGDWTDEKLAAIARYL